MLGCISCEYLEVILKDRDRDVLQFFWILRKNYSPEIYSVHVLYVRSCQDHFFSKASHGEIFHHLSRLKSRSSVVVVFCNALLNMTVFQYSWIPKSHDKVVTLWIALNKKYLHHQDTYYRHHEYYKNFMKSCNAFEKWELNCLL